MKRLICIIFFFSLTINIFATGQSAEFIYIEGEEWLLLGRPISNIEQKYYKELLAALPTPRACGTANIDGYTAFWSLNNNQLRLDSVTVQIFSREEKRKESVLSSDTTLSSLHNTQIQTNSMVTIKKTVIVPFSDIKQVFNDYIISDDIIASWYTGEIAAARGKMIYYFHGGYARVYEHELIFTFENGNVVECKKSDAEIIVEGLYWDGHDSITDLQSKIRQFRLHSENYPDLKRARALEFHVDSMLVDSLGKLINCRVTATISYSHRKKITQTNEGVAIELREWLMNIAPYRTILFNGNYFLPPDMHSYGFSFVYRLDENDKQHMRY